MTYRLPVQPMCVLVSPVVSVALPRSVSVLPVVFVALSRSASLLPIWPSSDSTGCRLWKWLVLRA